MQHIRSTRFTRQGLGLRLFKSVLTPVLMLSIFSCSTQLDVKSPIQAQPHLAEKQYTSFDGDALGYQKWRPQKNETQVAVKTVIIGVHGISGHAEDYQNFGEHLLKHNPSTALYQTGSEPSPQRKSCLVWREHGFFDCAACLWESPCG